MHVITFLSELKTKLLNFSIYAHEWRDDVIHLRKASKWHIHRVIIHLSIHIFEIQTEMLGRRRR